MKNLPAFITMLYSTEAKEEDNIWNREQEIVCNLIRKWLFHKWCNVKSLDSRAMQIFVMTSASCSHGDRKAEHLQQNPSPEGRKLCRNINNPSGQKLHRTAILCGRFLGYVNLKWRKNMHASVVVQG